VSRDQPRASKCKNTSNSILVHDQNILKFEPQILLFFFHFYKYIFVVTILNRLTLYIG
jgi:hypothetical protein